MMSRCLYLPYKSSNPRTVRGARRRGWNVINNVRQRHLEANVSWVGLNIWCEHHCAGYWISSFSLAEFAFENPADATFFKMKWG